jgi:hypothetical protein
MRPAVIVVSVVLILALVIGTLARVHNTSTAKAPAAPAPHEPAMKMADVLKAAVDQMNPMDSAYSNDGRGAIILAQLKQAQPNSVGQAKMIWAYADDLLKSGKSREGLAQLDRFSHMVHTLTPATAGKLDVQIWTKEALCYMRLGEDQNCCANRSEHACLLPIRGSGIHTKPEGSRGAIAVLNKLLRKSPKDLTARWLINIAYMTLGEYPAKVPAALLIPPKAFAADYSLKHFDNIGAKLDLDFQGQAGGVVMDDFDRDGFLDLMVTSWNPRGAMRYMHNNGDGTFTDLAKSAGLTGETGGLNMVQADYNNDGYPDVLILRGAWLGKAGHIPNSLLRNNGDNTFTDVTIDAGILSFHPTQTATWLDYNNDGWLDLFIGNESPSPDEANPCEFYRNNHDGTFTDVAHEYGLDQVAFVKAVISADYNKDGRTDLYLSCQNHPNMLFRNDGPSGDDKTWRGKWTFTDVASEAGVDHQGSTFSCFFFDYDNDGWQDLYVNGFGQIDVADVCSDYLGLPHKAERARLYHNDHNGKFSDVTKEAHLYKVNQGMGINFGDLDNDGYLDFYVGTGNPDLSMLIPNRMYHNDGGKLFQEVTTTGDFGHIQKGHAFAFGDINNAGVQDIYAIMGGAYTGDIARCALYKNPGFGNHWIDIKLEGVTSNRSAIGAQVGVTVATAGGDRTMWRTVSSGGSFGANPLRQEIGLGKATAVKSVSVFWPMTGQTQTYSGLKLNSFYTIREGDQTATELPHKSFKLPSGDDTDHTQMLARASQ